MIDKPMDLTEAQNIVATKMAPRVTKESIEEKINMIDYIYHSYTTICIIKMHSGFLVIGHSTPASEANYDKEVGKAYAYDNAFRQLWQLEGYLLKNKLFQGHMTHG